MRITILISISLLVGQLSCEQGKHVFIPLSGSGDTTLWFKWQQESFIKTGLPNLISSNDKLHFRFSTETQAIDIWTKDFKVFYGTLANFTTTYDENKYKENSKPELFYSNKSQLDTTVAKQVYNLFQKLSIFSIPTDNKIKGWSLGDDGNEYLIEYSTPKDYTFKEYWTPSYYKDRIKEAATIDSLANELEMILQMKKSFSAFIHMLPYGSYHAGSMFVITTSDKDSIK